MTPPQLQFVAYLDPTALIPIIFGEEPVGSVTQERLDNFPILMSSNFLETELRVAFERAGVIFDPDWLSGIEWVLPNRDLGAEMARLQDFASLSPARMWHLANAMYLAGRLSLTSRRTGLAFITLDEQQETAANELGFFIPQRDPPPPHPRQPPRNHPKLRPPPRAGSHRPVRGAGGGVLGVERPSRQRGENCERANRQCPG